MAIVAEEANNREALCTAAAADESRDCGGYEVSENNASTIQIQGHQSVSTLKELINSGFLFLFTLIW